MVRRTADRVGLDYDGDGVRNPISARTLAAGRGAIVSIVRSFAPSTACSAAGCCRSTVAAAEAAAMLAARQRQIGRTTEIRDVQIAGIAAARKATLATRNTRHFEHLGIALVDQG